MVERPRVSEVESALARPDGPSSWASVSNDFGSMSFVS